MQGLNLIALSIPVFFALIGVELLVARLQGKKLYRYNDAINDLNCGILQQAMGVFNKAIVFGGYVVLYETGHLLEIPRSSGLAWGLCFLGVDFFYYWFHRVSHESSLPWGAHIVHHQSEEYNLAVALRQGAFQPLFSWLFYLPLAAIGFPPLMFLVCSSFNTLYQFWIHTRLIGRLGPLEWVLNTPSHHRVHHGRDPKYIDRNHGGTLIVWDRLFGTFRVEEEEPVYGITRPLRSFNPLWANFQVWADLAGMAGRTRRLRDGLRLLWKRPGWRPEDLGGYVAPPEVDPADRVTYDVKIPKGIRAYVLTQFVIVTLGTTIFLFWAGQLPLIPRVAAAVAVVASLASLGGLLDRRSWAVPTEAVRLLLGSLAVALLPAPAGLVPVGLVLAAVSLLWLLRVRPAHTATTADRQR